MAGILLILVFLVVVIVVFYNMLITERNKVKNAWSQIDVQLQRRFDLIPNLIECVKGYMKHESETLEKVTALRSSWANAKTNDEKIKLDNELAGTLKTIMALSESYPDLKANQNFLSLQNDLNDTESKVAYSRQFYNDTVTKYNTKLEVFPSNIIANWFKFTAEPLFKAENDDVRKNVKVDFNN